MNVRWLRLRLRLRNEGRLLPWLGMALRGLTAQHFKDSVCVHPPDVRQTLFVRCHGCKEMEACAYGPLYEPDLPPGRQARKGCESVIRPLALAPFFPIWGHAVVGREVSVTLMVVGDQGERVEALLESLREAGAKSGLGEGVRFDVLQDEEEQGELRPCDLPATADALPGVLPRVGVGLTAPLFLKAGGRVLREPPELVDLLRSAIGVVLDLMAMYGEPIRVDIRGLVDAARGVRLVDHCFEPFDQGRQATRSERSYEMSGIQGGGVWGNVPMALLPWLVWGGRLHVGEYRVAGAGGWRLVLD
jgi:hypothetical protein